MVEVVVEKKSNTRLEYYVKAKANFKARSVANNVRIACALKCLAIMAMYVKANMKASLEEVGEWGAGRTIHMYKLNKQKS